MHETNLCRNLINYFETRDIFTNFASECEGIYQDFYVTCISYIYERAFCFVSKLKIRQNYKKREKAVTALHRHAISTPIYGLIYRHGVGVDCMLFQWRLAMPQF